MKIKEALIHDLLMQVTSAKISFSRMCELINEEFYKPPSEEQADINRRTFLRQTSNGADTKEYFRKGLNLKDYNEFDTI